MIVQPGEIIADRFRIERLAGSGGMGAVFRAEDLESKRPVALKVLIGEGDEERFAREARVLSALDHPAIVRHVAHGRTGAGSPYLAMEWLEGEDLAARLARGPLGVEGTLELGLRAGEALGAAHAVGVVHRDIKPHNLFLVGGRIDHVKLLDFGIAKVRATAASLTRTGAALGTIAYMAPEQVRGERTVDGRADVFALGCVLFECLTGRPPFEGAHALAVLAKILLEEAPRPVELRPEVPPALDDLVARMLSKDPARRPAGGREVAVEIAEAALRPGAAAALRASLTAEEQRAVSLIFVGPPEPEDPAFARTMAVEQPSAPAPHLEEAIAPFTAKIEALSDGSSVVILDSRASARDKAAQAARCALALRDASPELTIVAVTGWVVLDGGLPIGGVIDRAAGLLSAWAARGHGAGRGRVGLDDVTAGLLDERFEVAREGAWIELRGELRDGAEPVRTLLGKPTPYVGRDREIATLEAIFDECEGEPAACVALVTGPAGIGKSRVRREMLQRLQRRGGDLTVWTARADPIRSGSPFGMLAQVLRRSAKILDGEPPEEAHRKLAALVAERVAPGDAPRVAEFLGELAGVPSPGSGSVMREAARRDPRLMADQIWRAWEDLLASELSRRPVLLVLEDLHWADLPSIQLVDAALRASRERPLMVVAFSRPEVRERFPDLWASRGVQEIRLVGLSRRSSERLIRHLLGDGVGPKIVERVIAQAEGNALYLEELIRSVAEGKADETPATLLAMVQTRLDALTAEERRTLRAASVFGATFWLGGVCALLGERSSPDAARDRLAALAEREIVTRRLESRFAGEVEYAFRHDLIREAVSATLTDADRAAGRRAAGEWLEAAGEHDAWTLAELFDQGGDAPRAIRFYAAAAMQALEADDLEGAVARADRGVALGAAGPDLGRFRFVQAEARQWMGDLAGAVACGVEAMSCLDAGSPDYYGAGSAVVRAAGKLGRAERVVEVTEQMRARSAEGATARARLAALAHAAVQLDVCRLRAEADALLAEIEESARRLGADLPLLRAMSARVRSNRVMAAGDNAGFLALRVEATRELERMGDVRNACAQRANIGFGWLALGAYPEAERVLRQALAEAERFRLHFICAMAKHNLGLALAHQGALEEGREMERDGAAMFKEQGARRLHSAALAYLAMILLLGGDGPGAEREARAAMEASDETPLRAEAFGVLAGALLFQERTEDALAAAREAVALAEASGVIVEGDAQIRLALARALDASGRRDEAREVIVAARGRLLERAEKIGDPALRASFLDRVPENARTLELATEWTLPQAAAVS